MNVPPPPPNDPIPGPPTPGAAIPNHQTFAVIATVFATIFSILTCCCLPIGLAPGITAMVFANKVGKLIAIDDLAGARAASANAKLWSWITAGFGGLCLLLWGVSFAAQLMGYTSESNLRQILEQLQEAQKHR
jgi:hypothetical protein